jgi:hypothetical protein
MTDIALAVLVPAAIVLALCIDLAVLLDLARRRWRR